MKGIWPQCRDETHNIVGGEAKDPDLGAQAAEKDQTHCSVTLLGKVSTIILYLLGICKEYDPTVYLMGAVFMAL